MKQGGCYFAVELSIRKKERRRKVIFKNVKLYQKGIFLIQLRCV